MLGGARSWPSSLSRLHAPEARASGASRVHQPDLFGLRGHRAERFVGALALLPGVWDESAPRPQRRAEPPVAGASAKWAGIRPSDANVARWGVRSPRTRGALAPAECQDSSVGHVPRNSSIVLTVRSMIVRSRMRD